MVIKIQKLEKDCQKLKNDNLSKLSNTKYTACDHDFSSITEKLGNREIKYHLNYKFGPNISVIGKDIENNYNEDQTQGPK
jgi:hypothetical protein